jgi:hypothetical protein
MIHMNRFEVSDHSEPTVAFLNPLILFQQHPVRLRAVHMGILFLLTLMTRWASRSLPYFVDGPGHVKAVQDGTLIIQPPGYFLFEFTGLIVSKLFQVSPSVSLSIVNIMFGVSAVLVFYFLSTRFFDLEHSLMLSLVYAASPLVWFVADIHSTYAAMTLFAPLLFLLVETENHFVLGCLAWSFMAGFRPSDGVFVVPWMLYHGISQTWSTRIKGGVVAVAGVLLWWLPTAQRMGGRFFSPITASKSMASSVAHGPLTSHLSLLSVMNVMRGFSGMLIAWGVLLPFLAIGAAILWHRHSAVKSSLIWMIPGIAFFLLYYVADATYFSFCVAPGLIIVGFFLRDLAKPLRSAVYSCAITASLLFIFLAHPIEPNSKPKAILDAYFMKYSVWSLKHQYGPTLSSLLGVCGQKDVLGTCK